MAQRFYHNINYQTYNETELDIVAEWLIDDYIVVYTIAGDATIKTISEVEKADIITEYWERKGLED